MKDKELKLNASGYYDEPCYKAMTAPPKPGEIWVHNTSGAYMLVLANKNTTCSTLRLLDVEKPGSIPVMCKAQMYTTPIMVGYCFESLLTQYVKTVPAEEFTTIRLEVARALGLEDKLKEHSERDAQQNTINDLVKRNTELLEERDKLLEEIGGYGETIKNQAFDMQVQEKKIIMLGESLAKVEREADKASIYKEMYMTLLDKVISARGKRK